MKDFNVCHGDGRRRGFYFECDDGRKPEREPEQTEGVTY